MPALPTTIGVELEISNIGGVGRDVNFVRARLQELGLTNWVVKTDGSCGRRGAGVELNSPILRTTEDLATVDAVCGMLRQYGFHATPKCGLHVHVGVRELTPEQRDRFIRFCIYFEDLFYTLAPTRRGNHFCAPLTPHIITGVRHGQGWTAWNERYHWLNGCAFRAHTTAEFRLMSGSLNAFHVTGWVNLLLHIYTLAVAMELGNCQFSHAAFQGDTLFGAFLEELGLTDTAELIEGTVAFQARKWVTARYKDAGLNLDQIREERKRRRMAAWQGASKYVAIISPKNETLE